MSGSRSAALWRGRASARTTVVSSLGVCTSSIMEGLLLTMESTSVGSPHRCDHRAAAVVREPIRRQARDLFKGPGLLEEMRRTGHNDQLLVRGAEVRERLPIQSDHWNVMSTHNEERR